MKSSRKRCRHSHPSKEEPLTPETPKRKFKLSDAVSKISSCTRDTVSPKRKRCVSLAEGSSEISPCTLQWLDPFKKFTDEQKLSALDLLIDSCDTSQVRYILGKIEPRFQRDFISLLPKELSIYVLQLLEPTDLLNAARTCKAWKTLCDDTLLWKEKCRQYEISSSIMRSPKEQDPDLINWKKVFLTQQKIDGNWRTGKCSVKRELRGHDDHVITCLQFYGDRIISGSDDNTLKVWCVTSGQCLLTLVGHTGGVWCSQFEGDVICSGSTDRTIKVWDIHTGNNIHTLFGHTSTVRCLSMHKNIVVSGSRDATLRVWDVTTGDCQHMLIGHMAAVRCVQYDGKRVVSGAYDCVVKIWDPETEQCIHSLIGHTNRVYSLQFDGSHIVSGSLDTSIRVWDANTGSLLHTLIGHQSLTSGMELKHNTLVSGNADSTVKIWDISSGHCLQTLNGPSQHKSAVTCLLFNKKYVITSSDDGTVKLWDITTGEFLRNIVTLASGGSGGVVWRIQSDEKRLVCAVGSRNGTEETKLLVFDFDCLEEENGLDTSDSSLLTPNANLDIM